MRACISIIDSIRGTNILEKYSQLQSLAKGNSAKSADEFKLSELLLTLKTHNNYYKPLLSPFSTDMIQSNPYEVLLEMPKMDKNIINENFNKIFTGIKGRPFQKKKTGGSTGSPFYYYVDKDHLSWFWAYIYFFWNRYSGYHPGNPFMTIAGNSLRTNNRRLVESVYHRLQNNYFIKGDIIDSDLNIDYSKTNKAKLLYGYPSSIMNILKVKPGFSRNVRNLRAIFTTSEQLQPKTRALIESGLRVPVYDMYGANDGGILTCECEKHDGYHINTSNCYVESFINEHGMNELLLTNLNSYNFPLVRYRVGDLGKIETTLCDCGLGLPKITELKGRTRDLIKLKNGSSIHGSLFNNIFYKHTLIDGYKIIQHKDLSITLYLHISNTGKYNEISEAVKKEIHLLLDGVDVIIEKLDELNPTNEKFKVIESHAI